MACCVKRLTSEYLRRGDVFLFEDWVIIINGLSKTVQFSQLVLMIPLPRIILNPLCPYTALLHAFLLLLDPFCGPAFVFPTSTEKGWSTLTFEKCDSLFKLLATKENRAPTQISGHSFRDGGTTLAFQANSPPELIKRFGDWRSVAYRSCIHIPVKGRMHAL